MVSSVLLSIPLLEEEVTHNNIELSKKLISDKGGDENADDDPESEDWGYFCSEKLLSPQPSQSADGYGINDSQSFCNHPEDRSTPPPKI